MSILTAQEFGSTCFLSYIIIFFSSAVLISCKRFLWYRQVLSRATVTPLLQWQGMAFSIRYGIWEMWGEGRQEEECLGFVQCNHWKTVPSKSDIRKFLREKAPFFSAVFKVLFIFKFCQQIFLLQCIVHVLLSSLRSFPVLSKVLMYLRLH